MEANLDKNKYNLDLITERKFWENNVIDKWLKYELI